MRAVGETILRYRSPAKGSPMSKSIEAFRTISEVAQDLDVPKHVLRFWEVKFPQIRPMKRGGGRRYYRPEDMVLLRGIQRLLHAEGYTIKGVQKILREHGVEQVKDQGLLAIAEQAQTSKSGARPAGTKGPKTTTSIGRVRTLPSTLRDGISPKASRAMPNQLRANLEAAIRELKVCREILTAVLTTPATKTTAAARKAGVAR
jgi:DNA-binding transcriptional MerR regulator